MEWSALVQCVVVAVHPQYVALSLYPLFLWLIIVDNTEKYKERGEYG